MGPRLWLVRHAESTWNSAGVIQGHQDPPLSVLGKRQADLVARRLSGRPLSAIYSSDLARCLQTAGPMADRAGCEVRPDPGLRELDFGAWAGLTGEQVQERWPEAFARWRAGEDIRRGGCGETHAELEARALGTLGRITAAHAEDAELAVVTHGGWIRAVLGRTLRLAPPMHPLGVPGNASLTLLGSRASQLVLEVFNDQGHLDAVGG